MRGITQEGKFATAPGWKRGAEEERPLLDVSCFSEGLLVVCMWVGGRDKVLEDCKDRGVETLVRF